MPSNNTDPNAAFTDLTPDDQIWRLGWLGEVAYTGKVRRYCQPSLKVSLSPLLCDPGDREALLRPDSTDHQHSHEVWAPISLLPLLVTGDLWQRGDRVASPEYPTERFENLRINPKTATFVKAGLAIKERFLLPLSRHPWHLHHTHSYCVLITQPRGIRVIIPCLELIRFYFGSSGNLIQRLFTTPLVTNALWAKRRYNSSNQHLHLVLADRLSGASAADIGRIAASRFARRSAAGIYTSCQKASAQREPVYPYTGFPFEGRTDLVASGIWLPFGDRPGVTFLVYQLKSCSFPFPFRSLSYESSGGKARHGGHRQNESGSGKGRPAAQTSKTKPQVTQTDPGTTKKQRSKTFKSDLRFPDLERKRVWRDAIEAMPAADVFLQHKDGSLEQVAYGESGNSSSVASVDLSQAGQEETPLPKFVKDGLDAIAANPEYAPPGATIKLVCAEGKTDLVFALPLIVDENGEILDGLLFTRPDGSTRPRRGCFVEVNSALGQRLYLLITEAAMQTTIPMVTSVKQPKHKNAALVTLHAHV